MTLTLVAVYGPHALAQRSHAPVPLGELLQQGAETGAVHSGAVRKGQGRRLGPRAGPKLDHLAMALTSGDARRILSEAEEDYEASGYEQGDRIVVFGFSRRAALARKFVGEILADDEQREVVVPGRLRHRRRDERHPPSPPLTFCKSLQIKGLKGRQGANPHFAPHSCARFRRMSRGACGRNRTLDRGVIRRQRRDLAAGGPGRSRRLGLGCGLAHDRPPATCPALGPEPRKDERRAPTPRLPRRDRRPGPLGPAVRWRLRSPVRRLRHAVADTALVQQVGGWTRFRRACAAGS